MRTRLTIDLDPSQKQRLTLLAKRRKTSVRALVLESLELSLEAADVGNGSPWPSLAGSLKKWADPARWEEEQRAWGESVVEPTDR